jgi:hypothetical protein
MKKLYTIIMAAMLLAVVQQVNAQGGFDQLIKSSPADATKLVGAYAAPLFRGFGTGLNSGWNNTAKTKSLLHFDLRLTGSIAFVPTADQSFDVRAIGLSNHLTPDITSPTTVAPTFGGDKNAALPIMDINNDAGVKISSFTMPKAILSVIPAPSIQLTVGLIANTDLTIRTIPTISMGSDVGSVGMFGFGLKHNFMGSGAAKVVPFDLALAFNYNRISYSKPLTVTPPSGNTPAAGSSTDFSNQHIDAAFSGVNVQAIISKKLVFFTPFLSVGYQTASTNLSVLGNYPVNSTNPLAPTTYVTVTDPVSITETSVTGMRADLGFQLELGFFKVYASGSAGKYASVNGGIGFGF